MRKVVKPGNWTKRFPVVGHVLNLPRTFHLTKILDKFERLLCFLTCQGDIVTATIDITTALAVLRQPDNLARRTVVANTGHDTILVYEEGGLVTMIEADGERQLPLSGKLLISAQAQNFESTVVITTFRRCLCGDTVPLPYGESEPIGGNLL